CSSLSLGNYTSGWRLPSVRELSSIVAFANQESYPLLSPPFPNQTVELWSSTPSAGTTNVYWYLWSAGFYNDAPTTWTEGVACVHDPDACSGCTSPFECLASQCQCPGSTDPCSGLCVSLASDSNHCGTCTNTCSS